MVDWAWGLRLVNSDLRLEGQLPLWRLLKTRGFSLRVRDAGDNAKKTDRYKVYINDSLISGVCFSLVYYRRSL